MFYSDSLRGLKSFYDASSQSWLVTYYERIANRLKVIDYKRVLDDDRKQRLKMNHGFINSIKNKVNSNEEQTDDSTKENLYNKPWKEKRLDKSLRNKYTKKLNQEKNEFLNAYNEKSIDKIRFPNEKYKQAPKQDGGLQPAVNSLTYFEKQQKNEKSGIPGFQGDNFQIELKQVFENRTCDWFKSKQPYILIKKIIRKCNRKHRRIGYGEDFLRTLTRTMNRFSKVSFEFTEDMVELVLERVFGKNIELQDNIFDVEKLLRYLRNAMAHHDKRDRDSIIDLKPRHCMSVSVPGCFCRPGFVESSGQCVKPADCITESSNEIYLTRIIVH